MWWIDPDGYYSSDKKYEEDDSINTKQKHCWHNWKPILLLTSTVYDCSKCGVKKEDYEKWSSERA